MAKATHSPAPWRRGGQNDWRIIAANNDKIVAPVGGETPAETDANANLIAAAPDLLAACEEVEHNLRHHAFGPDDLKILRAAIAKARGK